MAKKKLIILICVSIIAVLSWYFCLFTPYNYLTAKLDIQNGKVQLISVGKIVPNNPEIDSLNARYGFTTKNMGCVVTGDKMRGINFYNHVVNKFLAKKNGENWNENYNKQISEMQKD